MDSGRSEVDVDTVSEEEELRVEVVSPPVVEESWVDVDTGRVVVDREPDVDVEIGVVKEDCKEVD